MGSKTLWSASAGVFVILLLDRDVTPSSPLSIDSKCVSCNFKMAVYSHLDLFKKRLGKSLGSFLRETPGHAS